MRVDNWGEGFLNFLGHWDYTYDNRYRLTAAERHNASGTIHAHHGYTNDAGDNMTAKVLPFEDDFNSPLYTGWDTAGGVGRGEPRLY